MPKFERIVTIVTMSLFYTVSEINSDLRRKIEFFHLSVFIAPS